MNTLDGSFVFSSDFIFLLSVLLTMIGICFMSIAKAISKRNERRYRQEQRELLKWQMELEKMSSELHYKKR